MPDATTGRRWFVCGSRQRFEHWCRENGHNPHERDVVHVNSREKCQGHRLTEDDQIVDCGDAYPLVRELEARRVPLADVERADG